LFLASTAGSCLQEHDPDLLANVIPAVHLPDKLRKQESPVTSVTTFVSDLVALLIFEDVQIRDTARDALGAELSPRLYMKILKYFDM